MSVTSGLSMGLLRADLLTAIEDDPTVSATKPEMEQVYDDVTRLKAVQNRLKAFLVRGGTDDKEAEACARLVRIRDSVGIERHDLPRTLWRAIC
jgi:hypothetical protein